MKIEVFFFPFFLRSNTQLQELTWVIKIWDLRVCSFWYFMFEFLKVQRIFRATSRQKPDLLDLCGLKIIPKKKKINIGPFLKTQKYPKKESRVIFTIFSYRPSPPSRPSWPPTYMIFRVVQRTHPFKRSLMEYNCTRQYDPWWPHFRRTKNIDEIEILNVLVLLHAI